MERIGTGPVKITTNIASMERIRAEPESIRIKITNECIVLSKEALDLWNKHNGHDHCNVFVEKDGSKLAIQFEPGADFKLAVVGRGLSSGRIRNKYMSECLAERGIIDGTEFECHWETDNFALVGKIVKEDK
jgi:hypothetical protein